MVWSGSALENPGPHRQSGLIACAMAGTPAKGLGRADARAYSRHCPVDLPDMHGQFIRELRVSSARLRFLFVLKT